MMATDCGLKVKITKKRVLVSLGRFNDGMIRSLLQELVGRHPEVFSKVERDRHAGQFDWKVAVSYDQWKRIGGMSTSDDKCHRKVVGLVTLLLGEVIHRPDWTGVLENLQQTDLDYEAGWETILEFPGTNRFLGDVGLDGMV